MAHSNITNSIDYMDAGSLSQQYYKLHTHIPYTERSRIRGVLSAIHLLYKCCKHTSVTEGMFTTHHIVRANWCCHEQQSSLNTWTRSLRDLSALPCERAGCGHTARAAQTVNRQHNTTPEPVPATGVELMAYAHGRIEQSGLPPRAAHTAHNCLTTLD